ncbi:hypothetical protein VPR01S_01_03520 [Vibrio proteolyticus NBRC 13287]|uniref:Fumarylacetoacetase-like C-terminal domain-containing protein n=1 Tax=Vibrio proteolyticus NBRC 13287 TaxID=1219065 RepID=U3B6U7_VIBPR|nr:hypothetical protein VPR01S_01_03520 [Vibrio proteolyticus NBRC 13287]
MVGQEWLSALTEFRLLDYLHNTTFGLVRCAEGIVKRVYLLLVLLWSCSSAAEVEQYVRYLHGGTVQYGLIQGTRIQPVVGNLFDTFQLSEQSLSLSEVTVLLPVAPGNVYAVGLNFASHMASSARADPPMFVKLYSSLIPSGQQVVLPAGAKNLHFEGELVVVIGKTTQNISEADAMSAVFGYLVGNDLTERTWQAQDLQWIRAKSSDGFGPVSARITRGVDFRDLEVVTRLNNKVVQQETMRTMIHKPAKVIAYLSQYFVLRPGDLIFMGTPGRTEALRDGDEIEVSIKGVGSVTNRVSAVD